MSKIAGTSAEEGAGYLMSVGQKARVTDPGRMARSIGPALTAATSHEASLQTGGAMYAALTGSMVDETGEKTKTAVIKLADSLDEFLPKISTAHERIKALQADPKLQEKFLDKYSFETDAKEPIKQIVTGQGAAATAYSQFQSELPNATEAGDFYQQWLTTFQGGALQVTAAMGRATDQLKEGLRTADQGAARIGLVTADLKTTLRDAGMSALGSSLEEFGAKIQGNELGKVLEILDQERVRLASPHMELAPSGAVQHWPTAAEMGKASALANFTAQIRQNLDRETHDQAHVRESRAIPAPPPGSKLPSRAEWISGKISWEEATGLPPQRQTVPVRNVEFPPQPSAERVRIGVNRQFPDVASPPTLPYPKVDGPTTIPA
ncbi:MAG: hypothetical protein GY835_22335, partial [bacterium]|nr:hypothetical protein [bacterium]